MTQNPTPEPPRADPPSADPTPEAESDPAPAVEVDVARTGGIAGMTRRWTAQPPEGEASEWISLIDRCPWHDVHPHPVAGAAFDVGAPDGAAAERGAATSTAGRTQVGESRNPMPDGFVWFIRATWSGADPREAELHDDELVGAWRELVEAVRQWSRRSGSAGSERPGR